MTDTLKTVQALVRIARLHRNSGNPAFDTQAEEAAKAGDALIEQMQREAVQPADVFWLYELTKGEGIYQGVRGPNAEQIMRQVVSGIDEAGEPFPVYAAPHPEAQQDDHAGSPAPSEPQPDFEAWGLCSQWETALTEIAEYAHDKSTGPAVPDALWEIRRMAYDALDAAPAPSAHSSKAALSDEEIVKVAWEMFPSTLNEFWINEIGIRFARAILARAGIGESRREPLTDHRCIDLIVDCGLYESKEPPTLEEMCSFIRTIEAEHGITKEQA